MSELSAGGGTIKSLQHQQRYLSPASGVNSAARASTDEKRAVFFWKTKLIPKRKLSRKDKKFQDRIIIYDILILLSVLRTVLLNDKLNKRSTLGLENITNGVKLENM